MFTTVLNCLQWPQNLIAAIGIKEENGDIRIWDLNDDQMDGLIYVLDQLTEKERVAIYFKFLEEMTLKQISVSLEISVSRAQQLISKGVEKLGRSCYVDYYYGLQANQKMKSEQKETVRNTDNSDVQIALLKEIPLESIDISERTRKSLLQAGIFSLGEVAELLNSDPGRLVKLRHIGKKSVNEILQIMEGYGLDYNEARYRL